MEHTEPQEGDLVERKERENKSPPVKVVVYKFKNEKEIKIMPLGDIHWDAIACNRLLFKKIINYAIKHNVYLVFLGDMINKLFFDTNKSDETMTLTEALAELEEILLPAKHLILVLVEGNHDEGIEKRAKFSIIDTLGRHLDAPVIKGIGVLHFQVGKNRTNKKRTNSYVGIVLHGWGGGRSAGAKLNKVLSQSNHWHNIDFVLMGHLHDSISKAKKIYEYDIRKKVVRQKHVRHIIVASTLDFAEYSQKKGYAPGATMNYIVKMSGTKRKLSVIEDAMEAFT